MTCARWPRWPRGGWKASSWARPCTTAGSPSPTPLGPWPPPGRRRDARAAGDPLSGRDRGQGGQGRLLRQPGGRRRPGGAGGGLRRRGRRRAGVPGYHRDRGGSRDPVRGGRPHRRAGAHPADGRRRGPRGGGRGPAAARRGRQVSGNSAAVRDPELLSAGAGTYGAQCMVLAVDARRRPDGRGWEVVVDGGRTPTGRDALAWAEEGARRGAGELLVTSMDADGRRTGYDLGLVTAMTSAVDVPVIASGGAGGTGHFVAACQAGADAVLAASVFHFGQLSIAEVKRALASAGLPIRT